MAEPSAPRSLALPPLPRVPGQALLLLPLLTLVCVLVYLRVRPVRLGPTPSPGIADPEQTVAGFATELRGDDGSLIRLRLSPLHAEPERQAFEARALRARLGLEPGQPWRLSVRWVRATEETQPGTSEPEGLSLGALEIEDDEGRALAPIAPPIDSLDPLATLLRAPAELLLPGSGADLVLWGRAPKGDARLLGWPMENSPVLVSSALRRAEIEGPLARLDRATPRSVAAEGAGQF